MVFNTIDFFQFFIIVLVAFHCWPRRHRWILLLASSYYFYMCWHVWYVSLIALSTLLDYVAGIMIHRCRQRISKRLWVGASLAGNLGILFAFKYYNFFNDSLGVVAGEHWQFTASNFLLPVGISFYTFQSLSYTIDVYRGRIAPERHLGIFAVYVSFFPQLVAGPIERSETLLPQLKKITAFDYDRNVSGLLLVVWGLIKKVVIADRLAVIVNAVYNDPTLFNGPALALGTLLFAYQIYCDFSGYSDIAIGTARMLGVDLMRNFDRPYAATTISGFWRRWHISLSTWFRDYVYIPLGGNRNGQPRWMANILLTFLISGLWHGASWTFVIWGAFHGVLLILEHLLKKPLERVCRFLGLQEQSLLKSVAGFAVTFCCVNIGWILFRANSVGDAIYVLSNLGAGWSMTAMREFRGMTGIQNNFVVHSLLLIVLLEIAQYWSAHRGELTGFRMLPAWVRWPCYYAAAAMVLFLGYFGPPEFIYFQF